jgi:hypothetical protein
VLNFSHDIQFVNKKLLKEIDISSEEGSSHI